MVEIKNNHFCTALKRRGMNTRLYIRGLSISMGLGWYHNPANELSVDVLTNSVNRLGIDEQIWNSVSCRNGFISGYKSVMDGMLWEHEDVGLNPTTRTKFLTAYVRWVTTRTPNPGVRGSSPWWAAILEDWLSGLRHPPWKRAST